MPRYPFLSLTFFLAFATPLFADSLELGAILPLSGPTAPFGEVVRKGVVGSGEEGIQFEDDACEPQKALTAFKSLRQKGIHLFLGPCCTSSMAAVAPLLEAENAYAMIVCTGSDSIWEHSKGRVFHPQYSAQDESRFNAARIYQRGFKKVVIIFMEHEYSRAHEQSFRESFPGRVVAVFPYVGADKAQLKDILLKLKAIDFDALYIPIVEPFFLGILSEGAKLGINLKQVFSVFSFEMPDVLASEGKRADGVIYSFPETTNGLPAAEYFAGVATSLFKEASSTCKGDGACIKKTLFSLAPFNSRGVLRGKIILKTVKNGRFVPLEK